MPFFPNPFQPARRPYSPEDRPTTRRGLARLVLRDHFFDLPPLNLLLAAVYAPALLWAVTGFFYILEAMGDDGGFQDLISLSKTWVLVFIPLGTLTGPAAGGMAAVTRDLARDRSRLPWFTFRTAVRSCWTCPEPASPLTRWSPPGCTSTWPPAGRWWPCCGPTR